MVRFFRFAVLLAVIAFILLSCTTVSNDGTPAISATIGNDTIPDDSMLVSSVTSSSSAVSDTRYPEWIFVPSSYDDAKYKYFSGSSDITVSDRMARQRAMSDAASGFASWWEQNIETVISTSSLIVDDGEKQSYVQTFETRLKISSSVVISGLETVEQWKNPDTGELWLLTRVPKALIWQTFCSVLDETSSMEEFKTDEGVGIVAETLNSAFDELLQKGK